MESIYILEPGSYLRREGMALKVFKDGEVVDNIPADGLKRLMLIGRVSLSGAVLDFLIQNRVETVFITPTGRFRARLVPDEHKHVALRKAQYLRLSEAQVALRTASIIVRGKAANMGRMLLLRGRDYGIGELRVAAARMHPMAQTAERAKNLEVLRGVEGAGARIYFSAFPHLIRNPQFTFNGRNKRPPLDPLNALMSFAYTLLTNEVLSAVKAVGLDPYLGALHEESYGRPSLACDLVNRRLIGPDDFVYRTAPPAEFSDEEEMRQKRPVEMKPAVCRAFIAAYEEMMQRSIHYPPLGKKVTYRWLIMSQVRMFGACIEDPGREYAPFLWET
jgi:CRISPR-associated protein Cas1